MIFVGFIYPDIHLIGGLGACDSRGAWRWCELAPKAFETWKHPLLRFQRWVSWAFLGFASVTDWALWQGHDAFCVSFGSFA